MQGVCLLGATGSIGQSTLELIQAHPNDYYLHSASGHKNWRRMLQIIELFSPSIVVMTDAASAEQLQQHNSQQSCHIFCSQQCLIEMVQHEQISVVVAAIVGSAGLAPTFAAVQSKKRILLANKESLVVSGELFMQAVKTHNVELLPVDSEHNAIFQCLSSPYADSHEKNGVEKILLTASGGPFRTLTRQQLQHVTPEQAVKHPNWSMGKKISVDSASLMNKGLELIEACWLFNLTPSKIEVVIHPQSIIHSMVQYKDGSIMAQMGQPDMKTPIAYGLSYPKRMNANVKPLDFFSLQSLTFEKPDVQRFACLQLAQQAFEAGAVKPAMLNAANEVAVDAFLRKKIAFLQIADVVEQVMQHDLANKIESIEHVLQIDQQSRLLAGDIIETFA